MGECEFDSQWHLNLNYIIQKKCINTVAFYAITIKVFQYIGVSTFNLTLYHSDRKKSITVYIFVFDAIKNILVLL